MTLGRREFVRAGLLATGAAAAGIAAKNGSTGDGKNSAGDGPPETVALTPDGRLVAVREAKAASAPPQDWTEIRRGIPGRKWVMVIDLAQCDGCGDCVRACNEGHAMPPDREWIRLYKMQDAPETAPYWFPKPCFHCDNPPCVKVCPVGATFKREDGIILVDNTRCIGCRYCMAACPYSSRVFNWSRPSNPRVAPRRSNARDRAAAPRGHHREVRPVRVPASGGQGDALHRGVPDGRHLRR
jgi:molybdopterin-containing oxidoreductase family iron-sulfur binding subunit